MCQLPSTCRVRDGAPASHGSGAEATNRDYYAQLSTGRDDYWRKMAAPRFRVATFLRLLSDDPPASLVDVGCGNGLLLDRLEEIALGAALAITVSWVVTLLPSRGDQADPLP